MLVPWAVAGGGIAGAGLGVSPCAKAATSIHPINEQAAKPHSVIASFITDGSSHGWKHMLGAVLSQNWDHLRSRI